MVTFEDALKIVRDEPKIGLVWSGFSYLDSFVFLVSAHKKYIPGDTETCFMTVNKQTGKVGFMPKTSALCDEIFIKSLDDGKLIDITEEQLNQL